MNAIDYRDVAGFPGYRVGSDGSVWSCWRRKGLGYGRGIARVMGEEWRQLKATPDSAGYMVVSLCRNKKTTVAKVHLIMLAAFVGPRQEGMQGCHEDGNPGNCAASNLRWDTAKGNNADKVKHGTHQVGERHPYARLTNAQVAEIKRRLAAGESCVTLGRFFGVAAITISNIKTGRTWSWLTV